MVLSSCLGQEDSLPGFQPHPMKTKVNKQHCNTMIKRCFGGVGRLPGGSSWPWVLLLYLTSPFSWLVPLFWLVSFSPFLHQSVTERKKNELFTAHGLSGNPVTLSSGGDDGFGVKVLHYTTTWSQPAASWAPPRGAPLLWRERCWVRRGPSSAVCALLSYLPLFLTFGHVPEPKTHTQINTLTLKSTRVDTNVTLATLAVHRRPRAQ